MPEKDEEDRILLRIRKLLVSYILICGCFLFRSSNLSLAKSN